MKHLIILLTLFLCAISTPVASQWARVVAPDTAYIQCLYTSGTMLLGGSSGYFGPSVYASTDNGDHWERRDTGFEWNQKVSTFYATATYLYAGTSHGVMRSSDDGKTWENVLHRIGYLPFRAIISHGKYLFAAGDTVYRSNDSGNTWVAMNKNLYPVNSFVTSGSSVLGTTDYYVARTTNDGTDWYGMTLPQGHYFPVTSIIYQKPRLITAEYRNGYYLSSDLGVHWDSVDAGDRPHSVTSMVASGTKIFAGRSPDGGVFLSEDDGSHWLPINKGLGDSSVLSLTVSNGYLFAATLNGVWRRSLIDLTGDGISVSNQISDLYDLYPNPSAENSTIAFTLDQRSQVRIEILDLLGQSIRSICNDIEDAGSHAIHFETDLLQAGSYFIRVNTNGKQTTKRLEIIR